MGTHEDLLPIAAAVLNDAWKTRVKRIWIEADDKVNPVRLMVGKTTFYYRSLEDLAFTLQQVARQYYEGEARRDLECQIKLWLQHEECRIAV